MNLQELHWVRSLSPKVLRTECLDSPATDLTTITNLNFPSAIISPTFMRRRGLVCRCQLERSENEDQGGRPPFLAKETSAWPMILGYTYRSSQSSVPNVLMAHPPISPHSQTPTSRAPSLFQPWWEGESIILLFRPREIRKRRTENDEPNFRIYIAKNTIVWPMILGDTVPHYLPYRINWCLGHKCNKAVQPLDENGV